MIRNSRIGRRAAGGLVALTAVLAAALVAGSSTAGAAGTVTLTVLVPSSGLQTGFQAVAVHNFELAYPNIKVQLDPEPSATYDQVLLTELQAGNAPDVFYTNGGSGSPVSVVPLAKAGRLVDLTKSPWAKRVPAAAASLYWIKNKLYGLPLDLNPLGVVYNVAAFKTLGITPPTTFGGLLSTCRKIAAAGKIPIAVPGQFPRLLGEMLAGNYVYSGDPTWDAKRVANTVTFAGTKGWHTAIDAFDEMNKAGCFVPGVQAVSVPQSFSQVGSGQALMYTGPASGMGGIQAIDPTLQLAMFPLPGDRTTQTRLMAGYYDSVSVNAQSHNIAAAEELVDFMARQGQSELFAKVAGGISLHDAHVGAFPEQFSLLAPLFKAGKAVPRAQDSWPDANMVTALDSAMIGSITGQLSVDQGLAAMDTTWASGT
jgi:raffinose/stachyose/melibiose transport system substrate-binding protein